MIGASLPPLSYPALVWIAGAVGIALLVWGFTTGFPINLGFATFTLPAIPNKSSRAAIIVLAIVCFVLARWAWLKGDYESYTQTATEILNKVGQSDGDAAHRRAYQQIWAMAGSDDGKQTFVVNDLENDSRVEWIPAVIVDVAHDAQPGKEPACIANLRRMLLEKEMSSQAGRWQLSGDPAGHISQREIVAGDIIYQYLVRLTPAGTEGVVYLGEVRGPGGPALVASNIDRDQVPRNHDRVQVTRPLNVNSEAIPWNRPVGAVVGVIAQNSRVEMLTDVAVDEQRFAWGRVRLISQSVPVLSQFDPGAQ